MTTTIPDSWEYLAGSLHDMERRRQSLRPEPSSDFSEHQSWDIEPYDPEKHGRGPAEVHEQRDVDALHAAGFEPQDHSTWHRRLKGGDGAETGEAHVIAHDPGRRDDNGRLTPWLFSEDPDSVFTQHPTLTGRDGALAAADRHAEEIRRIASVFPHWTSRVQKTAAEWTNRRAHPECGCQLKELKQMSPDARVRGWMIDHRPHGGRVRWKVTDDGVAKEQGKARTTAQAERDVLDAYSRVAPAELTSQSSAFTNWTRIGAGKTPAQIAADKWLDENPDEFETWHLSPGDYTYSDFGDTAGQSFHGDEAQSHVLPSSHYQFGGGSGASPRRTYVDHPESNPSDAEQSAWDISAQHALPGEDLPHRDGWTPRDWQMFHYEPPSGGRPNTFGDPHEEDEEEPLSEDEHHLESQILGDHAGGISGYRSSFPGEYVKNDEYGNRHQIKTHLSMQSGSNGLMASFYNPHTEESVTHHHDNMDSVLDRAEINNEYSHAKEANPNLAYRDHFHNWTRINPQSYTSQVYRQHANRGAYY